MQGSIVLPVPNDRYVYGSERVAPNMTTASAHFLFEGLRLERRQLLVEDDRPKIGNGCNDQGVRAVPGSLTSYCVCA
jgi:hypothetical protein